MARLLRVLGLLVVMVILMGSVVAPVAYASDPLTSACKGVDAKKSPTCSSLSPKESPLTGTSGLLYKVSVFLSSIAGIIAVVMIMVGGFKYVTSSGDAQQATSARKTIVGAVVGLIIIALAETIITFVVRKV